MDEREVDKVDYERIWKLIDEKVAVTQLKEAENKSQNTEFIENLEDDIQNINFVEKICRTERVENERNEERVHIIEDVF